MFEDPSTPITDTGRASLTDSFERLALEEYRALRAESLRCAGLTTNTVWLGTTQFAVTIAAIAAMPAASRTEDTVLLGFVVLCVEAIAASILFLGEAWKYVRVGRFIREKSEKWAADHVKDERIKGMPLGWETWIRERRTRYLYGASIVILQLPIGTIGIGTLLAAIPSITTWIPQTDMLLKVARPRGAWTGVFGVLLVADLISVGLLVRWTSDEGRTEEPLDTARKQAVGPK